MRPQWVRYKKLELIPDTLTEPTLHLPPVQRWLRGFWRSLTCRLLMGEEPGICQVYDQQGQPCSMIYDPSTGRTTLFRSDEEFLRWYNQRFANQRSPAVPKESLDDFWHPS
jgi:hypothetical protein